MEVGVKFRAYPTQEQKKILSKWIGCARFIYNAKCDEDRYHYAFSKQALSLVGQKPKIDQAYAQFKSKELSPWLYEVPSQILRNASYRWFEGYQRTFKGLGGRPQKKSKHGRQGVWLTSELFEFVVKRLVSRTYKKIADIREDFAHKTSHSLVNSQKRVFVFEDLKVANMTKCPKKKWSEVENRYLPNGAKAKAGLNRSILQSTWGKTLTYLSYKAKYLGKLVLEVASHYSSQTCAQCQHTCPESRQNQSDFVCVACGHIDNADRNAARVLAQRGIKAIKEQRYECVVGGTPKTKNGRGAKQRSLGKNANGLNREKPERKETSKKKNLVAEAA
jgi:transposase